jgi:hypothetical protein
MQRHPYSFHRRFKTKAAANCTKPNHQ